MKSQIVVRSISGLRKKNKSVIDRITHPTQASRGAAENIAVIANGLQEANATMQRILFYADQSNEIKKDVLRGLETCNAILEASNARARNRKTDTP